MAIGTCMWWTSSWRSAIAFDVYSCCNCTGRLDCCCTPCFLSMLHQPVISKYPQGPRQPAYRVVELALASSCSTVRAYATNYLFVLRVGTAQLSSSSTSSRAQPSKLQRPGFASILRMTKTFAVVHGVCRGRWLSLNSTSNSLRLLVALFRHRFSAVFR